MRLKQPGFTYKASGLFTKNKNKERIKKLKEKVREDIFIKTNYIKLAFSTKQLRYYKDVTSMSKNVYIDKLDDIINKYNITYHSTIKNKFVNVKQSTHINFSIENYVKNPRFKVGGYKSILKYKLFLQMLYSKFV